MLGINKSRVRAKRCKLKIPQYGNPRRNNFPWEEWEMEKCREHISAEKVAKAIGRTVNAIWSMRRELGLHRETGIATGKLRRIDNANK
jgi:hypothetical protein